MRNKTVHKKKIWEPSNSKNEVRMTVDILAKDNTGRSAIKLK